MSLGTRLSDSYEPLHTYNVQNSPPTFRFCTQVFAGWEKLAYPSLKSLAAWVPDLLLRVEQLNQWTAQINLLRSTWLPVSVFIAISIVASMDGCFIKGMIMNCKMSVALIAISKKLEHIS